MTDTEITTSELARLFDSTPKTIANRTAAGCYGY
jgi:hypothetical protein